MTLFPVILSGGSGTRLWPLSREQHPKQLLSFGEQYSLLQKTASRLDGMRDVAAPLIVCNREYRFIVAEQLRQIKKERPRLLLEPFGRNTAPALTLAALALRDETDAVMMVMPADHVIANTAALHAAIASALPLAAAGNIVTFGIVPDVPETGYGYIRAGKDFAVREFVEKPDAATAQRYLDSGEYFWNSGMFLLTSAVWLAEVARLQPAMLQACTEAFERGRLDDVFLHVDESAFERCPGDSIDYAVMEKTERAAVVPLDCGWSDVGAWAAVQRMLPKDREGNATVGDVVTIDTTNSLLMAHGRLLAVVGLKDVVVVETADAVLVAHKDRTQDVKKLVESLRGQDRDQHKQHRKVYRPWGSYETMDVGPRFQVKRITVKPKAALSSQMHHHRAEHWVVVRGTAKVTRGDDTYLVGENESTFIPLGTKHRLENPGAIPLEMIEVQSGPYLGEDDIVRFDDQYNRV